MGYVDYAEYVIMCYDYADYVIMCYERGLKRGYGYLIDPLRQDGEGKRPYIGFSQAGHCQRQVVYSVHPDIIAPELSTEQRAIFTDGYLFEVDTLTRLDAGGLAIVNQGARRSDPERPDIYGHQDAEGLMPDGKYALLEVKSMRGYPQKTLLGKGGANVAREFSGGWTLTPGTTARIQPDYYKQVQCYLWAATDLQPQGAIIIYRMKEDGRIACERILFCPQDAQEAVQGLREAGDALRHGSLPERAYRPDSDWQCRYCQYSTACRNDAPVRPITLTPITLTQ